MEALLAAAAAAAAAPPSLDSAERLWRAARAAILEPDEDATAEQVAAAFKALDAWRAVLVGAAGPTRAAGFVAGCALRMAALDAATDKQESVRALLGEVELGVSHAAVAQAAALLVAGEHEWNSRAFAEWNQVAYAVCFDEAEEVPVNEPLIARLADFDAACAARDALRRRLEAMPPGPTLAQRAEGADAASLAWRARATKGASDDVYALVREAAAWAYLTPAAYAKGTGAPSARLAAWDADRATAVTALDPESPASPDFLFLFDYAARQMLDLPFLDLFFAHDYDSAAAMRRLDAFVADRLRSVPPLVVRCGPGGGTWHVVSRVDGALRRDAVATAREAALSWMDHVMQLRGGALFLGKRLGELYEDITTVAVEASGALVARTEAVM
jgi:hypothetical protein